MCICFTYSPSSSQIKTIYSAIILLFLHCTPLPTLLLQLSAEQGTMKVWGPSFNIQIVLLLWATGSVTNGNLSAFDVIGGNAHKIVGDNIVTTGNEESCLWQHHHFNPRLCRQSFVPPYSTDNRSIYGKFSLSIECITKIMLDFSVPCYFNWCWFELLESV